MKTDEELIQSSAMQPQPVRRTRRMKMGGVVPVVLACIGIGLLLNGYGTQAANGVNQVYAAVNYCSGWIVVSLAFVVDALAALPNSN